MSRGTESPKERKREKTMELTFNKGIIRFSNNSGKAYVISVNDNTIQNETTKKLLKNLPSDLIIYLRNIFDSNNLHLDNFRSCIIGDSKEILRNELLFADKLASLNIELNQYSRLSNKDVTFIKKNFTAFAKYKTDTYSARTVNFSDILFGFINEYNRKRLCKYAIADSEEYEILEYWFRHHDNNFDEEEYKIPYIMYFLNHGLIDFSRDIASPYSTKVTIVETIDKYFNYCKILNREPQKGDIFKQIIEMSQTYQMKKNKMDTEAITAIKEKFFDKINFSTNDYFIHIPTTAKEFEDESEQMHNCVYRMYLPKVIAHNTIVVFVRKKENPNASYITCEINMNTGEIKQFLGKFNNTPTDPKDKEFKKLYTEFLNNNF